MWGNGAPRTLNFGFRQLRATMRFEELRYLDKTRAATAGSETLNPAITRVLGCCRRNAAMIPERHKQRHTKTHRTDTNHTNGIETIGFMPAADVLFSCTDMRNHRDLTRILYNTAVPTNRYRCFAIRSSAFLGAREATQHLPQRALRRTICRVPRTSPPINPLPCPPLAPPPSSARGRQGQVMESRGQLSHTPGDIYRTRYKSAEQYLQDCTRSEGTGDRYSYGCTGLYE